MHWRPSAASRSTRSTGKRSNAAERLYQDGTLSQNLSGLHRALNEARKAVFYEGEEPDLAGVSIDEMLSSVEEAVAAAEADAR